MDKSSSIVKVKNVGVFCSASNDIDEIFKQSAFALGKSIAEEKCGLVTGGSRNGLIKAVIDGYTENIKVHQLYGALPKLWKSHNILHSAIPASNVTWTKTMHQRISVFHEKCDLIIIMPGGFGTLHELMDFLVHNQLGFLHKKILLYNIGHFWDYLLKQFEQMVSTNILLQQDLDKILSVDNIEACIQQIKMVD